MENKNKVRVRIAPSPTGHLHIGTARTALFNYIFAKQNNGKYLIRIEDTDRKRSSKEYENEIIEGLSWLGLISDEKIIRQSERTEIYKKYIKKLISSGNAYISKEKSGERDTVIRFKNPNEKITFNDIIRGEITMDSSDFGDFIIAKDEDTPLYNLVVVIDDIEMGITHIIRGEDHISNTQRQLLIQKALNTEPPTYAHLPLILAPDRSKLSKRHGAASVLEYREKGYLKEALINFLALLGWHPEGDNEVFDIDTLIKEFDLHRVQKGGAIFDINKLNYLNRQHLKNHPDINNLIELNIPSNSLLKEAKNKKLRNEIILERINVLSDITKFHKNGMEFDFFIKNYMPTINPEMLIDKKTKPNIKEVKEHLKNIINILNNIEDTDDPNSIKESLWEYATNNNRGSVLWPVRVALTGKEKSPDPFTIIALIGKEESIRRLKKACDIIKS